ncbi:MAG TPA: hypothetical protein VGK74_16085 [Symbiobacteriaceae bacterium]|jgi:hypothetical protein
MKRLVCLLTILLLAGCSTGKPKTPPPVVSQAFPPSRTPAGEPAAERTPLDKAAAAALPAVEFGGNFLRIRLSPSALSGFEPETALSPGGRWLAFTYDVPAGGADQPMVALAALPLPPSSGQPRALTWYPTPGASARTSPGLRLAGWLDEQQVVLLRAAPGAMAALRVEVLSVASGAVTTGAWFSLDGDTHYNLSRALVGLTADRKALMVNTGDLWRVSLPDGVPSRVKMGLPNLKYKGPAATFSPDGWTALYGGNGNALPVIPYATMDLRSGAETVLPPAWTHVAWGSDGRFAALESTKDRPGDTVAGTDGSVDFFATVTTTGLEGGATTRYPAPAGWLFADVYWAAPDLLLLEAARLAPDAGNALSHNRITDTALIAQPLDGRPARVLWEAPGAVTGNGGWRVAGRWLITNGRQIPLDGGRNVDLPGDIMGAPFTSDPARLIAWKQDGTVIRFVAGGREATDIGHTNVIAQAAPNLGGLLVRAQLTPSWVLLHSRGALGSVWLEAFRLP